MTIDLIGDIEFSPKLFPNVENIFIDFNKDEFRTKTSIERSRIVNNTLLKLIKDQPEPSYLLSEVIDYSARVSEDKILDGSYNLTAFEQWLNQHAGLNYDENRRIRGKISGKYIPREEYQIYFPISQNKVYPGTHTVTAHNPPDLDSTTASFFGWLDAFSCRVGRSLSVWNLPQGRPNEIISRFFDHMYSPHVFTRVSKQKTLITHVAMDIVQQDRLIKAKGDMSIRDFSHNRNENHVILVDDEGFYIGDWRVSDVDAVTRVQRLLNICLHLYEKEVVLNFTELFSKSQLLQRDCKDSLLKLFEKKLPDFDLGLQTFSSDDFHLLDKYLKIVLHLDAGCGTTVQEFFSHMDKKIGTKFLKFRSQICGFFESQYYDNDDQMDCDRSEIFAKFKDAYQVLIESSRDLRTYLERLDIAMEIKKKVLGHELNYVTTKAEIEEVREKINEYRHITVTFPTQDGRLVPVGVIHDDLFDESYLGTISFRDFCNLDEIKIKPYLQVISAIDHHKSTIQTTTAGVFTVSDVQSSNVITAENAFKLNDQFGTRAQNLASIVEQEKEISKLEDDDDRLYFLYRLTLKRKALKKVDGIYFVHPKRELEEYILFLNAIVDDTDLLAKCSWRDLETIVELINRIKSIQSGKEVQVAKFETINRNRRGLKKEIDRMLKNKDFYSFYKRIYQHRESILSQTIKTVSGDISNEFFADRKIQNQNCSISQFKLFPVNWTDFNEMRNEILSSWLSISLKTRNLNSELDLFLHMMSTIPSAQQSYEGGSVKDGETKDEYWITGILNSDESISRMKQFINSTMKSSLYEDINLEVTINGPEGENRDQLLQIIQPSVEKVISVQDNPTLELPIIIFSFDPGSLNSRKTDVTPFLPK